MYLYLPVNPEPWAIGPLSMGKKAGRFFPIIGRNQQLAAYKEAVASGLRDMPVDLMLPEGEYELQFWFWRRLESYTTDSNRKHTKHAVDVTNLQKATEDALQGVVIDNDKHVVQISSAMVEQGPEVTGGVGIFAQAFGSGMSVPPDLQAARIHHLANPVIESDNSWPPA